MKITVRQGVFETNSSACHSIVFRNNKESDKMFEIPDYRWMLRDEKGGQILGISDGQREGYIFIHLKSYGWGPGILKSLEEKLSYIASQCVYYSDNNIDVEGILSRTDDYMPVSCLDEMKLDPDLIAPKEWRAWQKDLAKIESDPEWQEVVRVVKECIPGCLGIKIIPSSGSVENGISVKAVINGEGMSLERLLFDRDVIILVDNDNH